jgi:hypothetical protein
LTSRLIKKNLKVLSSKAGSDLDRIRFYYLDGKKLPEKLDEKRRRIEDIHSMLVAGNTREECVIHVSQTYGIQKSAAYALIADAMEILGDITKTNKEAIRYMMTEALMKIAHSDNTDPETKIKAWAEISKINGLQVQTFEHIDLTQLLMPQQITFTADPSVLYTEAEQVNDK